ncbi:helix-turn-helix domain-containing protein [Paenibacillus lautus]|uniref:helix-turn-helix domain-containing protein n=1 Tax=Paenibacillus lautus TaxID=1401 RepID=UPI000BBDD282|nr:AraC family transcriptional regulator [Paenibacillus lautus]
MAQTFENVLHYVDEHYMDPDLTVKQLAHMARLSSTWRFTPIFQELTGKKPLHYVIDLRINRVKELLLRKNEPMRSIAQEVGYTDEYCFSRRFRQITGMSAYRKGCTKHEGFSRRNLSVRF